MTKSFHEFLENFRSLSDSEYSGCQLFAFKDPSNGMLHASYLCSSEDNLTEKLYPISANHSKICPTCYSPSDLRSSTGKSIYRVDDMVQLAFGNLKMFEGFLSLDTLDDLVTAITGWVPTQPRKNFSSLFPVANARAAEIFASAADELMKDDSKKLKEIFFNHRGGLNTQDESFSLVYFLPEEIEPGDPNSYRPETQVVHSKYDELLIFLARNARVNTERNSEISYGSIMKLPQSIIYRSDIHLGRVFPLPEDAEGRNYPLEVLQLMQLYSDFPAAATAAMKL